MAPTFPTCLLAFVKLFGQAIWEKKKQRHSILSRVTNNRCTQRRIRNPPVCYALHKQRVLSCNCYQKVFGYRYNTAPHEMLLACNDNSVLAPVCFLREPTENNLWILSLSATLLEETPSNYLIIPEALESLTGCRRGCLLMV